MTKHRIATRAPCSHLDTITGLCTCYQDRHAVNPDCLTIEQMLRDATVPPRCAYIDNPHAYAARPTKLKVDTVDTTRRGYGLGFWWFYWLQRGKLARRLVRVIRDWLIEPFLAWLHIRDDFLDQGKSFKPADSVSRPFVKAGGLGPQVWDDQHGQPKVT